MLTFKLLKLLAKYSPIIIKTALVGTVVGYAYYWMYGLERKIIHLERDAHFDQ